MPSSYTAPAAGDPIVGSILDTNFKHNSGMGTDMLPMDSSGATVDNTISAGSGSYRYKDIYFAGTLTGGAISATSITLSAQPVCQLAITSVLTNAITDSTWSSITFATEDIDVGGFHSTSSNTERITIPTGLGGLYFISASLTITDFNQGSGGASFLTGIRVTKNGTEIYSIKDTNYSYDNGMIKNHTINFCYSLSAADYIILQGWADTNSSTADVNSALFSALKIG